jgi:hypothetical protein
MPTPAPPKRTRFPVNRKDHTQKGPYLGPLLRKVLEGDFSISDPESGLKLTMPGKKALILRLVWSGLNGEVSAIKEILDRVDGKVTQKVVQSEPTYTQMGPIIIDGKPLHFDVG